MATIVTSVAWRGHREKYLRGEQQFVESKKIIIKRKKGKKNGRRNKSRAWRNKKTKNKQKKTKLSHFFLRCSDGRSLVARELKLVYSTKATSRYQERKDSVLHAPRGRGFSYSGSFSFKGRKWSCGSDSTTGLSFRP